MDSGAAISVPTGKTTPIEPAVPEPKVIPVPGTRLLPPAPVHEYSEDKPEPQPLDPSYVPVSYDFIEYLSPQNILLVIWNFCTTVMFRRILLSSFVYFIIFKLSLLVARLRYTIKNPFAKFQGFVGTIAILVRAYRVYID